MEHEIRVLLSSAKTGVCCGIQLPTTVEEVDDALMEMEIGAIEEIRIDTVSSDLECIDSCDFGETDINELNYLASLINDMSDYEVEDFQAIAEYHGSDNTVAELIGYTETMDDYAIMVSIEDEYDLGKFYIEDYDYMDEIERAVGNLSSYITFDYEAYGRDLCMDMDGDFTSYGWVEHCGNSMCYDGNPDEIPYEYIVLDPDWEPDEVEIVDRSLKVDELLIV